MDNIKKKKKKNEKYFYSQSSKQELLLIKLILKKINYGHYHKVTKKFIQTHSIYAKQSISKLKFRVSNFFTPNILKLTSI